MTCAGDLRERLRVLSRSGGEKRLRGSGAGTLGVPLGGPRCVGGLLGVAGRLSGTVSNPIDGRQPTRLPRPWDSPGKTTGVGCHFLLQCMKVKRESEVAQSCPTLSDPMDCSLPGSSIHGIFQAHLLFLSRCLFRACPAVMVEGLEMQEKDSQFLFPFNFQPLTPCHELPVLPDLRTKLGGGWKPP